MPRENQFIYIIYLYFFIREHQFKYLNAECRMLIMNNSTNASQQDVEIFTYKRHYVKVS